MSILHLPARGAAAPTLTRKQRSALRRVEHFRLQTAGHMVSVGGNGDDLSALSMICRRMRLRVTGGD